MELLPLRYLESRLPAGDRMTPGGDFCRPAVEKQVELKVGLGGEARPAKH